MRNSAWDQGDTNVKARVFACRRWQGALLASRAGRADYDGRSGPPMLREFRRGSSSGTGHGEALAKLGGAVPPRQADLRDPIVLKALCALLRSDWISGINLDVSDDPWSSEKAAPSAPRGDSPAKARRHRRARLGFRIALRHPEKRHRLPCGRNRSLGLDNDRWF